MTQGVGNEPEDSLKGSHNSTIGIAMRRRLAAIAEGLQHAGAGTSAAASWKAKALASLLSGACCQVGCWDFNFLIQRSGSSVLNH